MHKKPFFLCLIALFIVLASGSTASASPLASALGTGFTYQGKLTDGGAPANGTYDLEFSLYDALSGGAQVGSTVTQDDVTVTNGLFTVQLDFGNVFDGTALYLEIGVRPGASVGTYTAIVPRQQLSATPYAIYASNAPWSGLSGVPAGFADGVDNDTTYTAGKGLQLAGTVFSIDPTYAQRRVGACASGSAIREIDENGAVVCETSGIGDITAVYPGSGLVDGGESGDITLTVAFSGTGSAITAARSDHTHPGTDITSAVAEANNADLLDNQHGTYYQNASNINAGTLSTNFFSAYADLGAEGYLGNAANDLALNNGTLQATLNADLLDGYHVGNTTSNVPINNGTLNTNLNADLLDGLNASSFALTSHNHWGQTWTGSGTGLTLSGGTTGVSGSGSTYGVYGSSGTISEGGLYGVYGTGGLYGIYGTGRGTGVYGIATGGGANGVVGQGGDAGVVGDGNVFGVYGSSSNWAGYFSGNVRVTGNLTVLGTKSAVVDTKDYGTRTLYAVESPENWFEDFGTGQLTNGAAVITIEPVFAETVNLTEDYHVFLTPNGDCALYVDKKSPTTFTVRAMGGQTCSIAFDYRIVAKRLGYEDVRLPAVDTPPTVEPPSGGAK